MSEDAQGITGSGTIPFTVKGIILDMDGLMLDTERLEIRFYIQISREIGWPTDEGILCSTIGVTEDAAAEVYRTRYGKDYPFNEIWERTQEAVLDFGEREGIPHRPGLLVFLDHLKKLGIPLAVATSAKKEMARWKLEKSGILDRFRVLACGDEVKAGKPAPDVFLLAARRLNLDPADCVGFDDSPAGLKGLANAGIRSVFIKDLAAEPPSDVLAGVWRRCTDLAEAAKLFGQ
jgi:HAD superfamily hydrolase (TIGR01509 family)